MPAVASDRAAGTNLMPYIIVLIAVIGIVVLQMAGAIPMDAVGGGLVIAAATFAAALAIAVHEAWTKKRGVLGWIANIVVSLLGAFLAAQLGGPLVAIPLLMLVGGGGIVYAVSCFLTGAFVLDDVKILLRRRSQKA